MDYKIRRAVESEYSDLIDFASMVFYVNFPYRLPKLYDGHPEVSPCHLLVTEEDRIKAMVGSFPLDLRVGESWLKLQGIGTVSVHPRSRGKGYMQLLLKELVEDAKADGADLMFLGGQRQRYGYFGFDQAATQLSFTVSRANLRHKEVSTQGIRLVPLDEHPEYLPQCRTLAAAQDVEARREDFAQVLHTWDSAGWVLLKDGEFLGYASISDRKTRVQELALTDYDQALPAVFAIVEFCGQDVEVQPTWEQRALIRALNSVAEGGNIYTSEMINVLNYPRVIEAYLGLKARHEQLLDGRMVIEVRETGRFDIRVEGGSVRVTETACEPDVSLSHREMMRYLFSPAAAPLHRTALEKSWLPIPVTIPHADLV